MSNEPAITKRLVAGILAILLGGLGIHKFYLGYTNAGIIQLIAGFLTCGIFNIVGFIEGILYLVKSDDEFEQTYILHRREWF